MISVWTRRKSIGATLLVNELNNLGSEAQHVIGGSPPEGAVLWGRGGGNKFEELMKLNAAGIPVPLHILSMAFATAGMEWLARQFRHHAANDLLAGLTHGDYYVGFVPTKHEHRIHIYKGESIRVAMKIPRTDNPHPRYRSWKAGWKFAVGPTYSALLPRGARDIAKKAVAALGYDFGAVDLATKLDDSPVVWEVNSGPGLEGSTIKQYAAAILRSGV